MKKIGEDRVEIGSEGLSKMKPRLAFRSLLSQFSMIS